MSSDPRVADPFYESPRHGFPGKARPLNPLQLEQLATPTPQAPAQPQFQHEHSAPGTASQLLASSSPSWMNLNPREADLLQVSPRRGFPGKARPLNPLQLALLDIPPPQALALAQPQSLHEHSASVLASQPLASSSPSWMSLNPREVDPFQVSPRHGFPGKARPLNPLQLEQLATPTPQAPAQPQSQHKHSASVPASHTLASSSPLSSPPTLPVYPSSALISPPPLPGSSLSAAKVNNSFGHTWGNPYYPYDRAWSATLMTYMQGFSSLKRPLSNAIIKDLIPTEKFVPFLVPGVILDCAERFRIVTFMIIHMQNVPCPLSDDDMCAVLKLQGEEGYEDVVPEHMWLMRVWLNPLRPATPRRGIKGQQLEWALWCLESEKIALRKRIRNDVMDARLIAGYTKDNPSYNFFRSRRWPFG
ncbi:hypothetical protein MMC28_008464 [Mycoblastus sanguinarius]|nr:hypothetical protein [Mycoblastus sanguinarius]